VRAILVDRATKDKGLDQLMAAYRLMQFALRYLKEKLKMIKNILPKSINQILGRIKRRAGKRMIGLGSKMVSMRLNEKRDTPVARRYPGSRDSVLDCCIAYNEHGGYCIPLRSRYSPAAQRIMGGKVYEPNTIEYISKKCGTGDVVHAGTYFGDFIPPISKHAERVWAFEPNPENYMCSEITILINGIENVVLTEAGLGKSAVTEEMKVANRSGASMGGKSTLSDVEAGSETTRVKVVSVDSAIPKEREVSVIHLDVEGFEGPALLGALDTIRRCDPVLILESAPEESAIEKISALGYRKVGKVHQNAIFSN
jgi:FkbM family methyltransferase